MSEPPGAGSTARWAEFSQDPRRPDSGPLRASDRDRDVALAVLGEGYADGRLTKEEYDDRSHRTVASRTLGELVPLIADLVAVSPPSPPPPADDLAARAVRHWQSELRRAVVTFLVPVLTCWAVYVLSGAWRHGGTPWPAWVMLGTGINLLRVGLQRDRMIADERRRLERRQRGGTRC